MTPRRLFPQEIPMRTKTLMMSMLAGCLTLSGAAMAQDSMSKQANPPPTTTTATAHDSMKQGAMTNDSMTKDSMSNDSMKQDTTKKHKNKMKDKDKTGMDSSGSTPPASSSSVH
jgi:pentapeptide MXKDX repeat protein